MRGGGRVQVYYGFTAKFLAWGETNLSSFDVWMADVKRLLNQEGVMYKGEIVSTDMAIQGFPSSSFFRTLIRSYSESSTAYLDKTVLYCCRLAFPGMHSMYVRFPSSVAIMLSCVVQHTWIRQPGCCTGQPARM